MTALEVCGDRDLLLNISEISIRMGRNKKWTENFFHYLWSEKIICPVRYRTLGSEFFWKSEDIEILSRFTTEDWKALKIPRYVPSNDYRSINLQFSNLTKNKLKKPMTSNPENEEKPDSIHSKNDNAKSISRIIIDYLIDEKEKKKIDVTALKKRKIKLEQFAKWFGDKKYLSDLSSDSFKTFLNSLTLTNVQIMHYKRLFLSFLKWCQSKSLISNFEYYTEKIAPSKSKSAEKNPSNESWLISSADALEILGLRGRHGHHFLEMLEKSKKLFPKYLPGLRHKKYSRSDLMILKKEILSSDGIDIISRSQATKMIGLTQRRAENLLDEWENEEILKPIKLSGLKGKKYNRHELQSLIKEKIINPSLNPKSSNKEPSKSNKVNRIQDSESVASITINLSTQGSDAVKELTSLTGKTHTKFVQDALSYYIGVIRQEFSEEPNYLKVDKYAYELENTVEPVYDF